MSRFKAGDLALIIKAKHQENLGKVVTLISIAEKVSELYKENIWFAECEGPGSMCFESSLMPLRGDFTPEEVREMEKENA